MGDKWRAFRDTVDDTTSTVRSIVWMLVGVGVIITVVREWLKSLDTIQIAAIWVVLVGLGVIALTYFLDWRRKRNVDKIPELLARLDELVLDYIEGYDMPNLPETLLDDLARVLNLNIGELKAAARSGDRKQAEQAFTRFQQRYEKYSNPKKFSDQIMNMRLAGALMNENNVGLDSITNTQEYQRIYQRVRALRKQLPSRTISTKINEYFHQSEALYSMLLSIKPFENLATLRDIIPARIRAGHDVTLPIVEGYIDTLISAVRESINDYKRKGKEIAEKSKGK
jgi:hypothetical protein